jgi:DNA-binding winged helix-turn-helix (wHTH) protein
MTIANIQDFRTNTARKLVEATDRAQAVRPEAANPIAAVPTETEARGFALYLGVDEATAQANGTSLTEIASALKRTFAELVPSAANETFAAVALAPKGIGGRNVDVVRTALRDPRAIDQLREPESDLPAITVDLKRKRVYKNGINAEVTNKEFLLFAYLIENEGQVITRAQLVAVTNGGSDSEGSDTNKEAVTERTIDVHVRRLRAKIEGYEDVIRAVRGRGYTFEQHPDVLVEL